MRPVARPIAQSLRAQTARSGPGFPATSARKDCSLLRPSRISARRLEQIASGLSDLDRQVLEFVARWRLSTGKQLVARFWAADDAERERRARVGRRALKRLADWRVLDPLPNRARGGVRGGSDSLIYSVGVAGARLLARDGRVPKRLGVPGHRHIAHTLTTCEVAIRLFAAECAGTVECLEIQPEPDCWRPFMGAMGARLVVKPDLYLRVALPGSRYEYRWHVEIDMGSEHTATLLAKCQRYLAHYRSGAEQRERGTASRVLWVVPDSRRAGELEQVIGSLALADRRLFAVCEFAETDRFLTSEAST
jgi:Replication-relaxation